MDLVNLRLAVIAALAALVVVIALMVWRRHSRSSPLDEVGRFAAARDVTNGWSTGLPREPDRTKPDRAKPDRPAPDHPASG